MERKIIICATINNWYESEWYKFIRSWWEYTICNPEWDICSISKDTHHMSSAYKEFNKSLWEFLKVTFPK